MIDTAETSEQERVKPPFTREDIVHSYEEFFEKLNELRNNFTGSSEEFKQREQEETYKLLHNLLEEKHRWQHIFKTSRGSIYFMTEGGQSLPFKAVNAGEEPVNFVLHEPSERVFFISPEESERVGGQFIFPEQWVKKGHYSDVLPIRTVPLDLNVQPVEIIMLSQNRLSNGYIDNFNITESNNTIVITDNEGMSSLDSHKGSPITEIIK